MTKTTKSPIVPAVFLSICSMCIPSKQTKTFVSSSTPTRHASHSLKIVWLGL